MKYSKSDPALNDLLEEASSSKDPMLQELMKAMNPGADANATNVEKENEDANIIAGIP